MDRILGKASLGNALLGRWGARPHQSLVRSIAVASGKGGTGKSVITASLACHFAANSRSVTLFDADLGVGNAHILQGITPAYTAAHVASGMVELEDIAMMAPTGVKVLPAGSGVAGLASLGREALFRIARGFQKVERHCDLLFIDAAAGISDQTIFFLLAADMTLLITTPDLTAMTDAYALIKVLHLRNPETAIQLIVNRCHSEKEANSVSNKLLSVSRRFLGKEIGLLGWVPEDSSVCDSVAKKTPFVHAHPNAAASQALVRIADKIEHLNIHVSDESFSSRIQRHAS